MKLFEGVRDVLQEDEAKDDVLVLPGVHAAAKRVGHAPQLGLVADVRAVPAGSLRGFLRGQASLPCGILAAVVHGIVCAVPETSGAEPQKLKVH